MLPMNRFFPLLAFNPNWVHFFSLLHAQIPIPTAQVVYDESQQLRVTMARVFSTPYFLFKERVVTYDDLIVCVEASGQSFKGAGAFETALMVEVWEDHGDDGHVEFRMEGYRFVSSATLRLQRRVLDLEAPFSHGLLPPCMRMGDDDRACSTNA